MYTDYTKLCRVCMNAGARDIFVRQAGSSLKLLEKLRYVSMMKIIENDDLPKSLCDMCIVHLNVAYDFKRLAVENDTKLRQYYIENGLNSNNISAILQGSISPSNPSRFEENVLTSVTSTKDNLSDGHQPKIESPIFIKTEPDNTNISNDSSQYPLAISRNNNSIRVKDFAHLKGDPMVFINHHSLNNLNKSNDTGIFSNSNSNNSTSSSDGPSTSALPKKNCTRKSNLKAQSKKPARNKKRIVEGRLGNNRPREIRNLNIDLNWNFINAARNTRILRHNKNVINTVGRKKNNTDLTVEKRKSNVGPNETLDILDQKIDIETLNRLNLQNNAIKCNTPDTSNDLLIPKTEPGTELKRKSKILR